MGCLRNVPWVRVCETWWRGGGGVDIEWQIGLGFTPTKPTHSCSISCKCFKVERALSLNQSQISWRANSSRIYSRKKEKKHPMGAGETSPHQSTTLCVRKVLISQMLLHLCCVFSLNPSQNNNTKRFLFGFGTIIYLNSDCKGFLIYRKQPQHV